MVALPRDVDAPRVDRRHRVELQLDVVAQLLRRPWPAGLVVDELVVAVGMPIHTVDAAAQGVRTEPELEATLDPDDLRRLRGGSRVVPRHRVLGARPQSRLVGLAGQSRAPPARLQQVEQLTLLRAAAAVIALEHLVDDDPEPLGDGRSLRDPQHPVELIAQRTRAVGEEVTGRHHDAVATQRQERLQRRLATDRRRPLGGPLGPGQHLLVERARQQDLLLLRGRRLQDRRVDRRHRVGDLLPVGTVDQRRDLHQLQVAGDAVGDVQVGVHPQVAESRADRRDVLEQLVAQRPEARVEGVVRPEQLLVVVLPLGADRPPRVVGQRRRLAGRPAGRPGGERQHHALAGPRDRHVEPAPCLVDRDVGRVTGRGPVVAEQLGRQRVDQPAPRDRGARRDPAGLEPEDQHVVELELARRLERQHAHDAQLVPVALLQRRIGVRSRATGRERHRLDLAVGAAAGLGQRDHPAGEVAGRRLRRDLHVALGQLAHPRQVAQPLDDVAAGREQLLATQAEVLDQPVDELVRRRDVERAGRGAVEPQERRHAIARLGRHLRRLHRRAERPDEVHPAAAGQL